MALRLSILSWPSFNKSTHLAVCQFENSITIWVSSAELVPNKRWITFQNQLNYGTTREGGYPVGVAFTRPEKLTSLSASLTSLPSDGDGATWKICCRFRSGLGNVLSSLTSPTMLATGFLELTKDLSQFSVCSICIFSRIVQQHTYRYFNICHPSITQLWSDPNRMIHVWRLTWIFLTFPLMLCTTAIDRIQ